MLSGTEIIVVGVLVLVLFGPKRIPELAKSLGHAKAEFKKAQNEVLKERDDLLADPSGNAPQPAVTKTAAPQEQGAQPVSQIKS